jgi:ribosomal protein L40E
MSIFSKICPRCAGDNPVDVTHCQCGFVFEASATTGSYRALEMAEQEAQVYAEYLQARMSQAKETAEVAISDQARFPSDAAKITAAKATNEEYLEIKAEYDEQMKLVLALHKEAEKARAAEQKEQESNWGKARERAKQKAILAEKAALAAKVKAEKEAAVRKNNEQARLAAAKKTEQERQAKLKAEAVAKARVAKQAREQAGQQKPSPKMREKMADEAESAAERVRRAQSSIHKDLAAATSALNTDTPANRNNGAGKNHSRVTASGNVTPPQTKTTAAKNPNEKDCPNCTAIVPVTANECKCGYSFPQGAEQMDSIGLSDEDRANLLSVFQPGNGA